MWRMRKRADKRVILNKKICMVDVELHLKISPYEALVGIDSLSVSSINGYIEKMGGFLEEYFNLAKELRNKSEWYHLTLS